MQNGNLALNRQDTGNEGGEIVFNRASDNSGQWVNDVYGNDSTAKIRWHHGGAEKFVVKTNGHVVISNGNLELANGMGIDYSNVSDGSRSVSSNLLDDYEEGSFTPEYNTGSAGSAMLSAATYTNTSGFYTKIGRLVYVVLRIECASHTVMGGIVQINNLPFACQSDSGSQGGGFFHYINALDSTNTGYTPTLYIAGGASYIQMYETDGTAFQAGRGGTNWNNQLHLSVIYNTA